jgi:hypothetical protein
VRLQGYTDFDWAGSTTDRLSTSGCCFSLGSVTISWDKQEAGFCSTQYNRDKVYHSQCRKL